MAPFGLFKKKEKNEEPAPQRPSTLLPQDSSLSVQEAQALVQQIESTNVRALSSKLAPIKASAEQSLKAIGILASDMENEKIKLEGLEQRFKSLVENSRKTIVAMLKRETSTQLELPETINDVRRFREKFEGLMKRFGEVSGSHSKILNNFMKKNASRMKAEFETLEELLVQAKSIISEFEQKRAPIVECSAVLNTLSQKAASAMTGATDLESVRTEILSLEKELAVMKAEAESLRNSADFHAAESFAQEMEKARAQRDDLQNKMLELFSHISRAFTKYSYGVSKQTEARLDLMSSEPWKLLELSDISSYTELLMEVRKSVSSGKIQLKDTDKTIHYIDLIGQSLPDFQAKARQLAAELNTLRSQNTSTFDHVSQIEQKTADVAERLSSSKDNVDLLKRQNDESEAEIRTLLTQASDLLSAASGQKYSVKI